MKVARQMMLGLSSYWSQVSCVRTFFSSLMFCQRGVDRWAQHQQEVLPLLAALRGTNPGPAGTVQDEGVTHIYREKH